MAPNRPAASWLILGLEAGRGLPLGGVLLFGALLGGGRGGLLLLSAFRRGLVSRRHGLGRIRDSPPTAREAPFLHEPGIPPT